MQPITYMKVALCIGSESKCISKQVGAVFVRDNRILSTGYNGTPSGEPNCCEVNPLNHHEWSKEHEVHAEINAILNAAKDGISLANSDLYTTLLPCADCAKALKQLGVNTVYYLEEYSHTPQSVFKRLNLVKL